MSDRCAIGFQSGIGKELYSVQGYPAATDNSSLNSDVDPGSEDDNEVTDSEERNAATTIAIAESLKTRIKELEGALLDGFMVLRILNDQNTYVDGSLATCKKMQNELQREKNAICSQRRSEVNTPLLTTYAHIG